MLPKPFYGTAPEEGGGLLQDGFPNRPSWARAVWKTVLQKTLPESLATPRPRRPGNNIPLPSAPLRVQSQGLKIQIDS
jgi:hypothetical protein